MKDTAKEHLTEWIINFLKNRDSFTGKIELIEKGKGGFDVHVKYKDKEQFFIVKPIIKDIDEMITKFDEDGYFGLAVFNTRANLDALLKNWDKLARFKRLGVYFVNPFSKTDKRWIVYPYTHNNICERGALEKGLNSMFEMVEQMTEEQIRDRFK
ncbi:hypothetical protein KY358_01655 [Candidatus Woesearchaeota archaeon]|nr:hypothetical protein [Candidatus Woesearchaeota archaeon]